MSADSEERDSAEKRDIYAAIGIPHYWIIRNEAAGSGRDGMITMYELSGDGYRLVGHRLVSQLKNV